MRRSAPSSQALGVALFPFLAVLLCTMGALIVVLIVLSRQAHAQAKDSAQAASAEMQEKVEQAQQLLDFRIEQLRVQREKTQADLANRRFVLGQVEDHWRQLEGKLVELRRAYAELENVQTTDQAQRQAQQRDLEALEQQLAAANQAADEARRQAAGKRPSFAVVPYDGPNGTRRRPIYIECRSDAILIQPEGVRFAVVDFAGPLGPSNPLASGVRAVREYIAGQQKDKPQPYEPYPLLLVRPDGIEAYYLARLALADWDTEFGYEMIEADWPLEFPTADAALRDIVQQAVDDARVRQRLLAQHAPRQFGASRSRSFRAAPGGGIVPAEGPEGLPSSGSRGESGFARRGAGSGNGFSSMGRRGSGFGGPSDGDAARGGGSVGGDVDTADLPYASGLAGGTGDGRTATSGAGEPSGEGFGESTGDAGDPLVARGSSALANSSNVGATGASKSGNGTGDRFGASQRGSAGERGFGQSLRSGSSSAAGSARGAQGSSSSSAGATASTGASGATSASGAPGSPGAAGMSAGGSAGGDPSQGQVGVGIPSVDFSKSASPAESLAKKRGQDWGIPESVRGATPVGRPIRVECRGDRLVVYSNSRSQRSQREIVFAGPMEPAVDELVSTVWDEVEGWGLAGQGMYWHPTLNCDVTPDGQTRYAELQQLLEGSGLEVKARGTTASRPLQPLAAPR